MADARQPAALLLPDPVHLAVAVTRLTWLVTAGQGRPHRGGVVAFPMHPRQPASPSVGDSATKWPKWPLGNQRWQGRRHVRPSSCCYDRTILTITPLGHEYRVESEGARVTYNLPMPPGRARRALVKDTDGPHAARRQWTSTTLYPLRLAAVAALGTPMVAGWYSIFPRPEDLFIP